MGFRTSIGCAKLRFLANKISRSGLLYVYHREMTNAAKEASYPSCAIEGRYILAMGAIVQRDGDNNLVGVACSKLVDLSQQPEREPLWWMEVAAQDV